MMRLYYRGLSEIRGAEQIGLIVLTDEVQTRQIVVVCDEHIIFQFRLRMQKDIPCHRLLPEVLAQTLKRDSESSYNLTITSLENGVYKTMLVNEKTQERTAVRAGDGLLFAHVANLPIYIDELLFTKQSVPFKPKATGLSLPINAISEEMLQDALKTAIEREDYEMAEHLNQELKRRKQKQE